MKLSKNNLKMFVKVWNRNYLNESAVCTDLKPCYTPSNLQFMTLLQHTKCSNHELYLVFKILFTYYPSATNYLKAASNRIDMLIWHTMLASGVAWGTRNTFRVPRLLHCFSLFFVGFTSNMFLDITETSVSDCKCSPADGTMCLIFVIPLALYTWIIFLPLSPVFTFSFSFFFGRGRGGFSPTT